MRWSECSVFCAVTYPALKPWLVERGGAIIVGLALAALVLAGRHQWITLALLLGGSGALLAAALLYVLPGYPGELFHRLFVPVAVLATGAAGFAIWDGFARPRLNRAI